MRSTVTAVSGWSAIPTGFRQERSIPCREMISGESTLATETAPASVLRLATNTIVQIGGSFVASAVGLLTFVAVTRGLGGTDFGVLTTALVYLTIPVVLADVGLATVVVRDISARPERTASAMQAALPLRVLVSALAVGVAVALGYAIPFSSQTHDLIAIGALGSFLTLMIQGLSPVLQAQLKMHWAALTTIVGRLATFGLTLAVLAAGGGLGGVMVASVAGIGATFALQLVVVARIVSLRPTFDFAYWRVLLKGSIAIGLALAVAQIYFRVDVLLLAAFRDPAEVGLYGAAVKLLELSELVAAAIGISVFPLLARFVQVDRPRAATLYQRTFDLLIAAAVPLVVLMTLAATSVIVLISGEEYREAGDALRLLAPYVLLSFVTGLSWRALIAYGEDWALFRLAAGILTLNVVLNLIVIPVYGFRGAAATTIVSELTGLGAALVLLKRRHGLLPSLRYGLAVLPAAALMAVVLLAVPGPIVLRASLAGAAYVAALLLLPGTVRRIAVDSLLPGARKALERQR
jgi:O-antigen/teichoic acid export membrane protein